MALLDRVIERLGGVTPARLQEMIETQVQEAAGKAYERGFYDGNDEPPSGTLKSFGYRRDTSRTLRDFHKMPREKVLETVWTLWQSSPVAKRVIRIKRGYIIGDGVEPETEDETLDEILEKFWLENEMQQRQKEFTEQLTLFGEQCFPAFVRKADGFTRLGYIDPGNITEVIVHPQNALRAVAMTVNGANDTKQIYRLVQKDEDYPEGEKVIAAKYPGRLVVWQQVQLPAWEVAMLKELGKTGYDGTAFYFKINAVSNQPRGNSDLLPVADFIDQADVTLFSLADREQFAGFFSFDVTLNGADDERVKTRAKQIRLTPPAKGSVNVHNDAETWKLETPDLKQQGSIDTFIALMTNVMGGMGMPLAWYGYGNDTNRATLGEQGAPAWKQLRDDQNVIENMLKTLCTFARDQAIIAGYLPESKEQEIVFHMPEMTNKDITQIVGILPNLANALVQATDAGWMKQEKAAEAWAKVMGELGIEIDLNTDMGEPAPAIQPPNDDQIPPPDLKAGEARNNRLMEILKHGTT